MVFMNLQLSFFSVNLDPVFQVNQGFGCITYRYNKKAALRLEDAFMNGKDGELNII